MIHKLRLSPVRLLATIGTTLAVGMVAGIILQREIGIGRLLKRLGWRDNKLQHQELSPRFQALRQRPIPSGSIVFVGDSLVDLQEWHEVFPGKHIANRGVSGARIADLIGAFEYKGATAVFCLVGINDIGRGISVDEFSRHYQELLDSLPASCNFHAVSVPPAFLYGGMDIDRNKIHLFNAAIRRATGRRGFHYVDLGGIDDWGRRDFETDGLHLSSRGYIRVAGLLRDWLEMASAAPNH